MDRNLLPTITRPLRERFAAPWRALTQMEEEMERWADNANPLPMNSYQNADFLPKCELKETKNEYVAKFDVPGVKKEDLKIEVDGNRVTLKGERRAEKEEKDEKRYRVETFYGSFARAFTLPAEIDEKKVDAVYENGVLTISIPKSATPVKAQEIPIR